MAGRARRHPVSPKGTLIVCPVNCLYEAKPRRKGMVTELPRPFHRDARVHATVVLWLLLSGCSGAEAVCQASGGTYTGGTCILSSPERLAVKEWCETHGAVYLSGSNVCAFGEGQ